jgi:hypothetical protein
VTSIGWTRSLRTKETTIRNQVHLAAPRLRFALIVAYCIIGAATVTVRSARLLRNPWENTYSEAPQTYVAISAAQTGKLYIPMSQPPYAPQAYGPLYYAANVPIARLAHLDVDLFTFYSRLIAYAVYLLCGVMVFLICWAAKSSPLHSTLAALLMLGQPLFYGWNISLRPDMLCLFVMLLSLYCAVRWGDRLWYGYGLAGVLAGIAFLIKQPGLAVAIAIFVVLLAEKQFKKAMVLTVGTVAPVVIVLSLLFWRRDPFLQQMAFAGKSLWSVRNAAQFLAGQLVRGGCWIVPVCIGSLGFGRAVRLGNPSRMVASFALVTWLVGLSGMPQVGAYFNYFLPGLTGCALLLPYAIEMFRERGRLTPSTAVAGAIFLWALYTGYRYEKSQDGYLLSPTQASLSWLAPFRVLSDQPAMNIHGLDPNLLDPFGAHVLELAAHWDSTPILENLDHGEYDLIILTRVGSERRIPAFRGVSYFGPSEVKIINENYKVLCSTATSMVLEPRVREVGAAPQMFTQMFGKPCGITLRHVPVDLELAPGAR